MSCAFKPIQHRRLPLEAIPLLGIPNDIISVPNQDDDLVVEVGSYQPSIVTTDSQSSEPWPAAGIPRPQSAPVDSSTQRHTTNHLRPPLLPQDASSHD
jgi:hypothetical protein